jgi:hypothetical protein
VADEEENEDDNKSDDAAEDAILCKFNENSELDRTLLVYSPCISSLIIE